MCDQASARMKAPLSWDWLGAGLGNSSMVIPEQSVDESSKPVPSQVKRRLAISCLFQMFLMTTDDPFEATRALLLPIVQLVRQNPKLDDSARNPRRLGRRVCWKALQTPLVVKGAFSFLTNTPSGCAKLPEEGLQEWLMSGRLLIVIDVRGASLVKRNAVAFK